ETTHAAVEAVAVEEAPADLERGERIGAGVHELLLRQPARVPGAHTDVVGLLHLDAHHLPHQRLQPGPSQRGVPELARRKAAQVHGTPHLQPVVVPQLGSVAVDADADEGEAAVGEEVEERVGDVVGVEDLEDEAAAADAELQQGDGGHDVRGEGRAPLDVQADDEAVQAAAVHAVDLVQPPVHHVARVRERRADVVVVERHHGRAVLVVALDRRRHLLRSWPGV
ncbi:hypothetical protein U9M48_017783, partial [Paspalum notatum var. saurae]